MDNEDRIYDDEEFLTLAETSARTKFAKQSLYNMIHTGRFIKDKHYLKPSPRKILFVWPALREWIRRGEDEDDDTEGTEPNRINI